MESEPDYDKEPVDYVSIKFDGPEMDKPFNAALFDHEDGLTSFDRGLRRSSKNQYREVRDAHLTKQYTKGTI